MKNRHLGFRVLVPLAALFGGTLLYVACSPSVDQFDSSYSFKPCNPDNGDFDCIDLPDTFCEPTTELCVCWNEDGTKPNFPVEKSDQTYCQGACRPLRDCPWTAIEAGLGDSEAAAPQCETPSDCLQPPDARCGKATCVEGMCGIDWRPPGPLPSQLRGDCHTSYCDPAGHVVSFEDPSDFYDDGNLCTTDTCAGGAPVNEFYDGSCFDGHCFQGMCVECIDNDDCKGSEICGLTKCVPMPCLDDVQSGDETDVDCGGLCDPCGKGESCVVGDDCKSNVCQLGLCQPFSCNDGAQNDGETDVDCGGPTCAPCADGRHCKDPFADCMSGICWKGVCQAPSCFDGVANGAETAVDCGGSCEPCP